VTINKQIVYYDPKSEGKLNNWASETLGKHHYFPDKGLRGPVIVFDMLGDNKKSMWATLNFHRASLYAMVKNLKMEDDEEKLPVFELTEKLTAEEKCIIPKCMNCLVDPASYGDGEVNTRRGFPLLYRFSMQGIFLKLMKNMRAEGIDNKSGKNYKRTVIPPHCLITKEGILQKEGENIGHHFETTMSSEYAMNKLFK
jgi:hypothetical protein